MAISKNPGLENLREAISKTAVVRQVFERTILNAYPDMSNIKLAALQKQQGMKFAEAQNT